MRDWRASRFLWKFFLQTVGWAKKLDAFIGASKYMLLIWGAIFVILLTIFAALALLVAFYFDHTGVLLGTLIGFVCLSGLGGIAVLVIAFNHRPRPPQPVTAAKDSRPSATVDLAEDAASSDERVLVRYTVRQHENLEIVSAFPDDANERGEIELTRGQARRVRWRLQFVSKVDTDVPMAHFTILVPNNLVTYIVPAPRRQLDLRGDTIEEAMVSDSTGSVRLEGWAGPIAGRRNVTEMNLLMDIGHAREIPFRVQVTAEALGNVSYYGRIVAVMPPDKQLVDELMIEGNVLLSATVNPSDEPSTDPGSGDGTGLNAWLDKVRPLIRRHFGTEAHRVAPNAKPGISAAGVAAAIEQTMPPLINYRKTLPR
jgi:hypothetical protein